jgi:hypothetical protein
MNVIRIMPTLGSHSTTTRHRTTKNPRKITRLMLVIHSGEAEPGSMPGIILLTIMA